MPCTGMSARQSCSQTRQAVLRAETTHTARTQERFTRVLSLADTSSQLERVLASMRQLGQQLQQSGEAPKLQFLSLESKVSVLEGSILSAGMVLTGTYPPGPPDTCFWLGQAAACCMSSVCSWLSLEQSDTQNCDW